MRRRQDATCVARLRRAGAIIIGKTNLDQFATGLVGMRSPYGIPRNAFDRELIPGGSSSGSAVAVAAGLVPLALGTDTAGSGRIPAGLNNIVGLKPSLGLVSTAGVVPACRTLDCVSVFALTVDDGFAALAVMAGADHRRSLFARAAARRARSDGRGIRLGVPTPGDRLFFGDKASAAAYEAALARSHGSARRSSRSTSSRSTRLRDSSTKGLGWPSVTPARSLIASSRSPCIRSPARSLSAERGRRAVDAFGRSTSSKSCAACAITSFRAVDALVLPTMPTAYTVEQVLADPIQLNSRLGTYTNFVNLLELCAAAMPASMHDDGVPFGVTLLGLAGRDASLASIGRVFHADTALPLGATGQKQPPLAKLAVAAAADAIALAVVGAHLSGMALNGELTALGATFLETTKTWPDYRLFALSGTRPPKPGLLRVAAGKGAPIEVELWTLPPEGFGRFVAAVPALLSIGTLISPTAAW